MATPKINVLINEPDLYECIRFDLDGPIGKVYAAGQCFDPKAIDAIWVGLAEIIDEEFLKPYENVRYIVSNTTGVDHIRTTRQIRIVNLDPSEIRHVSATAEFTLALMLAIVRRIPSVEPFSPPDRKQYRGFELRGKQLGIFGMGRLGSRMARYAEALEMRWVGFDKDNSVQDKERILRTSDVITLHIPLRRETVDFINQNEFELMERQPFLINTSRPEIVNKSALIQAIETMHISGAALDFVNYDGSNQWDSDLMKYWGKGLFMTPHIGGNTFESIATTAQIVYRKFVSLISNAPLIP